MKNPRTPMFDFSALVEDPRIPATDYPEDTSMPLAWPAFAARMENRMARVSPSPRVVDIPEPTSIPTAEVYAGRPGAIDRSLDITSRVNPLDLLTAAGYQDPNQMRRRNTANQRKRLETERESAVGTAAGMLLGALLRGGEGADAVFDVSYPGLAGMESLIKFNRARELAEKGDLDDAMKAYLGTIVKAEDMNVDISKANQRAAENWNAVRDVDKAVDSDNKLHMLTTRTSGAIEDRPLWEMPEKTEGGDEGMTPYQRYQMEKDKDINKREAMKQVDDLVAQKIKLEGDLNEAKQTNNSEEVLRITNSIKRILAQIAAWQREGGLVEGLTRSDGTRYTITPEGKEVPVGTRGAGFGGGSRGKGK